MSNIGRAVPSIGIVFLFFAILGAGFWNITLALVLLAIPPILTNAYVGVREVDREAVDAARGMGMTGWEIARRVELPLALPLIFGGIRISAVNIIATATLGPEGGVVTLGDPIINPSTYGDAGRLGAAIVVAALAVVAEVGLSAVQRAVTPRGPQAHPDGGAAAPPVPHPQEEGCTPAMTTPRILRLLLAALALCPASPCSPPAATTTTSGSGSSGSTTQEETTAGIQRNADNAKTTLTVGSKNFTEQIVLGEIYAQAFEAAGYKVRKEFNLGDEQTALKALKGGQISGYPEYTGTILLSFLDVAGRRTCRPTRARPTTRRRRGWPRTASPRCRRRRSRARTRSA